MQGSQIQKEDGQKLSGAAIKGQFISTEGMSCSSQGTGTLTAKSSGWDGMLAFCKIEWLSIH